MIKMSISSYSLKELSFEEMLKKYNELGYENLEIVALSSTEHLDVTEWNADKLGELLKKYNMNMIALYPKPIDVHSEEGFQNNNAYIKKAIDLAHELECQRIVFSPLLPRENYDYAKLAEACKILADYIGTRGITICLENHHNWPLCFKEDYEKLFKYINDPRIAITMDTGHFTSSNVDAVDFIDAFSSLIKHIHLKDHKGTESVGLGCGETDNAAIFSKLRETGYDGYATIELEVRDKENIEKYLKEAISYCKTELNLP